MWSTMGMTVMTSPPKRPRHEMPAFVAAALEEAKLRASYE